MRLHKFLTLSLFLAFSASSSQLFAQQYELIDLGTLGGSNSEAHGINNQAQIVGTSTNSSSATRGFKWQAGTMSALPILSGDSSSLYYAEKINENGAIVGSRYGSAKNKAIAWASSSSTPLYLDYFNSNDESYGLSINNNDDACGYVVSSANQQPVAVYWEEPFSTNDIENLDNFLPFPPAETHAFAVNDAEYIVGLVSSTDCTGDVFCGRPYMWIPQSKKSGGYWSISDLGTLRTDNAGDAMARDINNSGKAVGISITNSSQYHAVLWNIGGSKVDLGALGTGSWSEAFAVNEAGVVVGQSLVSGTMNAFVYKNGTLSNLNSLIASGSGWVLTDACDINDYGQIVGKGTYGGNVRAYLLNPIATACDADLNHDGTVNGGDMSVLLSHWGSCPGAPSCTGDLNHDGVVNGADSAILLVHWNQSCP